MRKSLYNWSEIALSRGRIREKRCFCDRVFRTKGFSGPFFRHFSQHLAACNYRSEPKVVKIKKTGN